MRNRVRRNAPDPVETFTTLLPASVIAGGRSPQGGVMVRKYDTTFIIDGTLSEAQRQALIERFAGMLKKLGGNIEQTIRWGMRTLAYQINKRTHGYYVIFYYFAEPSVIIQFERELRLNENILRYMTLVSEGKHPEYIRDESVSVATPVEAPVETVEESTEEESPEEESEELEEEASLEAEEEGEAEGEEENTEEKENE
ncbi:MAG: 30S ribosomal protein S6 [Candidatus Latescibacterota bacterium]